MRAPSAGGTVVVMGPAYCDLVFVGLEALPQLGRERFAQGFLLAAGGSAITAIALGRLGHAVELSSCLGDDAHGRLVRAALEREAVGDRLLATLAGVPTPITVVLSTPADRAFVTYLDERTTAPPLEPVLATRGAVHLHVAGFPVARRHPDVVARAHAAGLTVSFDPGWDESALAEPAVRAVAQAADVLLPNRLEACRLADIADTAPAGDVLALLAASRRHDAVTVVKDGPAGAWGQAAGERVFVAAPQVEAVDPTGAGDVFDAGFLDALLAGSTLRACLERGARCGAAATTAYGGATSAPRRHDLEDVA